MHTCHTEAHSKHAYTQAGIHTHPPAAYTYIHIVNQAGMLAYIYIHTIHAYIQT